MPTITSKLEAPNTYAAHDEAKHGKCPSVTVNPGANDITDKQLAVLRKVPAYVAHVEGGYIVEGKTPVKQLQQQAESSSADAAEAAKQLEEAAKLAQKGGK